MFIANILESGGSIAIVCCMHIVKTGFLKSSFNILEDHDINNKDNHVLSIVLVRNPCVHGLN